MRYATPTNDIGKRIGAGAVVALIFGLIGYVLVGSMPGGGAERQTMINMPLVDCELGEDCSLPTPVSVIPPAP